MKEDKIVYRGYSLATLLTIVFLVLKLTGAFNWSWWWVFSPLWISAGISILVFIITVIIIIKLSD